jgi:hypothetical protein
VAVLGVEDLELPPVAEKIDAPIGQDAVHVEEESPND